MKPILNSWSSYLSFLSTEIRFQSCLTVSFIISFSNLFKHSHHYHPLTVVPILPLSMADSGDHLGVTRGSKRPLGYTGFPVPCLLHV